MGVMESRPGRSGRDAERLGDLGRGVPVEVMQDEDRPLFGRQPAEPTFEQVPVGDGDQVIGRGRSVDRQHPEIRGAATLARRLVDAFADDESVQPRVESVRIAEPTQVTPGDHQRILEGVLGPIDVAEDPLRGRVETVHARADQVDECRLVAMLGRLDEVAVHVSILGAPVGDGRTR